MWPVVDGHAEVLALHFIPACEKCSLTSIPVCISQVFFEHLFIRANLRLCAVILLSYATGWSRSRELCPEKVFWNLNCPLEPPHGLAWHRPMWHCTHPTPSAQGSDPSVRWFYLKVSPTAQTEAKQKALGLQADTLLFLAAAPTSSEFGQVISPLFLHFLISKMGMRTWPFHLCTVIMRISVFTWVKLPIFLSSFMDQCRCIGQEG